MKPSFRRISSGGLVALGVAILVLGLWPVPAEFPPAASSSFAQPVATCPARAAPASIPPETQIVQAGESIQAAVDQAHPGDTIQIMPGSYHEQITIKVNHLTLQGVSLDGQLPTLDGEGKLAEGIIACADQVDIKNLMIRNYTHDGVLAEDVAGILLRNLQTNQTGDYGLFPERSSQVTIENCILSGASEAGIYVGQSDQIQVDHNEAYANGAGIEIENSTDATVTDNDLHGNSAGLLMFALPDLAVKETGRIRVANNRLIANNLNNPADKAEFVSKVPAGIGLAVVGAQDVEISANQVLDNRSAGIAVVSLRLFFPEPAALDVDPDPRDIWVHDNRVQDNGADADPAARSIGLPAVDLAWDGSGWDNSWQEATGRREPGLLPGREWSVFARRIYYRIFSILDRLKKAA